MMLSAAGNNNICLPSPNVNYICMVCNRKIEANNQLLPMMADASLISQLPLVCGACKKFYWRNRRGDAAKALGRCMCQKSASAPSLHHDQPSSSSAGRSGSSNCRACRFARCEMVIAKQQNDFTIKELSSSDEIGNSSSNKRTNLHLVPCQVCGASSSGYHFGIISCEGCKGFFRRSLNKHNEYKCSLDSATPGSNEMPKHHDRRRCKRCRYEDCIASGMSNTAVRTGRHSMQRRIQTTLFVKQLAAENRLLNSKTFRRRRRKRSSSFDSALVRLGASATSLQGMQSDSSKNQSSSRSTSSSEMQLDVKPQHSICSRIYKLSHYLATMPLEIDRTYLSFNWNGFRIGEEHFVVENVAQAAVNALQHLQPLTNLRGKPITSNMTPKETWQTYLSTCFEPHLNHILHCLRSLHGFTDLAVSDRLKLFGHSYFPILVAQLSLGFDERTGCVNFLNVPDAESFAMLKVIFLDWMDLCRDQLVDAGIALKAWRPTASEFAMLIALIFFNPNVQGLADPEKVRTLKYAYEYVDSQINCETPERSMTSLSATSSCEESGSSSTNLVPSKRRFTTLVGYFQPMARLLAQALFNFKMAHPDLLGIHPVFAELYANMISPVS